MDRQLAERMVGAACLLAVLVLVVPAVLDGNRTTEPGRLAPAGEQPVDLRTHTIRLQPDERAPPVPVPRDAAGVLPPAVPESAAVDEPVPSESGQPLEVLRPVQEEPAPVASAATPPVAPVTAAPAPVARPPVTAPVIKPAPTGASASANGQWFVQLGSFAQRANAERLAAELERKGFSARVQAGGGAGGSLFRVRAGPVPDRAAAEDLAGRLSRAGYRGQVARQ